MHDTDPALFPQGPAATFLVPHDPLAPHAASSIPPTFLLAILCIIIGIPTYLIYQGAFKTSEDSLENKIKKADDSFSAAAGEKKEKKRDVDDPAPPLDLQDLQGLGGLVGLAAIVVMAFALFPEEINTMMGGLAERTTNMGMGMLSSSPPVIPGPPPIPPRYPAAPAYQAAPSPDDPYADSGMSDREYLREQGILPSWAEEMPEEQWWDSKSAKEIMLTCRIKPWLCDEDSLPIVKPAKRRRSRAMPQQTRVIRETVRSAEAIVTDSPAVLPVATSASAQVSFLEQHMAVLRSQPILMLPYDEDSVIDLSRIVIFMLFIIPLPFLYGYREMLINAGLVEAKARKEDKKLGMERQAEKEVQKNETSAAVSKAKAQKMRAEMKELEAADDLQHGWRDEFTKRPWWADANWRPDDEVTAKSKRPWRKERTFAGAFDYEEGDKKTKKTMVNARHYKLDFDAEEEEAKAKRYEATNARILAKYPTEQKAKDSQHFRGVIDAFTETSSGRETFKAGKDEVKDRVALNINLDEATSKVRAMRKAKKGSSSSKNQNKDNTLEKRLEKLAEEDQKMRDESRWTVNRFKDPKGSNPDGVTKIEKPTREVQQRKQAEARWDRDAAEEEERLKTFKGSTKDATERIRDNVDRLPDGQIVHWLNRLKGKKDKTQYDAAYEEVLKKDLQRRQAQAGASQQQGAPAGGAKPKGFLQKASGLLDKVGKA